MRVKETDPANLPKAELKVTPIEFYADDEDYLEDGEGGCLQRFRNLRSVPEALPKLEK